MTKRVPARAGNCPESIGGKPRTFVQLKGDEHVTTSPDQNLDFSILDDHAPEMNRLQAVESFRNLVDPRTSIPSPILGYQVKHGRPGLPFQLNGLELREPPPQALWGGGVAERDGDVLSCDGVDVVPPPAHQGDGVPVPRVVDVSHNALQCNVRYAEAHQSARVAVLHGQRLIRDQPTTNETNTLSTRDLGCERKHPQPRKWNQQHVESKQGLAGNLFPWIQEYD